MGVKGQPGALRRALANANIDRKTVALHTLRHSFACVMLQGGWQLVVRIAGNYRFRVPFVRAIAEVDFIVNLSVPLA